MQISKHQHHKLEICEQVECNQFVLTLKLINGEGNWGGGNGGRQRENRSHGLSIIYQSELNLNVSTIACTYSQYSLSPELKALHYPFFIEYFAVGLKKVASKVEA